ncbi:kinesin-II 95 kDa subunit-like [Convolutriloba macropyga]|uniref:kinesin-II 95 kDa subunit-like n=1 Tax=Convolutriloba macropyga TaxID=536237 RepID=UPI003F51EED2
MPAAAPPGEAETVKVVVRCRPLSDNEKKTGYNRIVEMDTKIGRIEITNPADKTTKAYTFDTVYDWNSKQQDLYDETFRGLVNSVLEGFNGTIFAYGQTGTGKTFTMEGVRSNAELRGVIPNSFDHIFNHIARSTNTQFLVRASYLEIYQEEIRDLLSKDQSKRLELRERADTGVYVKDLSSFVTKSVKEIEHVMNVGNQNRSVGATNMNEHSSRSHAIFIITVECSELGQDGENHIRVGKLNLVDLAGSERQSKTGSTGERLKEATKINLSLSALGNVISSLVDAKSSHIPYRDSKLTRLLQDSLGGNAKTVMVAAIGPASYNYEETLSTIRYANRAKNIKNQPKINEDPKDALLRKFQQELLKLREALTKKGGGGGGSSEKRSKRGRRKKKVMNASGEMEEISESEDDDEGEGGGNSAEAEAEFMKAEQAKLEEDKQKLMADQSIIAEQKSKLLADMEKKANELSKRQKDHDLLVNKIKTMESKLLVGGKTIYDHTTEQEAAIEKKRSEIAQQAAKEREMARKLAEKEETTLGMQETYKSLKEEVDVKSKRLKKLQSKLETVLNETEDIKAENWRELQELQMTVEELNRDLKMKALVIENFIPMEEKEKLMRRLRFNENENEWYLVPYASASNQKMAKRVISAMGCKRPTTDFARVASKKMGNPRYKGENILQLELELPVRTTRDYQGPTIAPRVQAALDQALLPQEGDLEVDAESILPSKKQSKSSKRPKTSQSRRSNTAGGARNGGGGSDLYPTARGLVSK